MIRFVMLVAALPCLAGSVFGPGVCYDVGKGSYSADARVKDTHDTVLCWAASSSNLIQYWQDTYLKAHARPDTPDGMNAQVYGEPQGTRYLNVYEQFLKSSAGDEGGFQADALNWWFKNAPMKELGGKEAYYSVFDAQPAAAEARSYLMEEPTLAQFREMLELAFRFRGQAAGLYVWQINRRERPGTMPSKSRFHAITCWGYETNAAGEPAALYLSDSDDRAFGVFMVHVDRRVIHDPFSGMRYPSIVFYTDDGVDGYQPGEFEPNLHSACAILTPEGIAKARPKPNAAPAAAARENTILPAGTALKEDLQVGNGANCVLLHAENLKLDAALRVCGGSLASVAALSARAVQNDGKLYLRGGSNSLRGVQNNGYLECVGADSIVLHGADNAGRLALRGNKSAAVKGAPLRNRGTALLCGKSAIRFENAALDSSNGTVLLGQDANGCTPTELRFTDAEGHTLSITSAPNAVGELHNVTITPTAIQGHGLDAALRNVKINGQPKLTNVEPPPPAM
ncbi:MAG: hypothetical protein MJ058_05045 [Akkermansia sp.]|nr:hypothetical protein [Akkermansia sp.]